MIAISFQKSKNCKLLSWLGSVVGIALGWYCLGLFYMAGFVEIMLTPDYSLLHAVILIGGKFLTFCIPL